MEQQASQQLTASKVSYRNGVAGLYSNLGVWNPLTFKIHGKPAVPVASVADAAAKWNAYLHALTQNCEEAGCSKVGNGGIVRAGKKIVARVSYNGRIWDAKDNEILPVRRHVGEEAVRLTNAEQSAHDARIAQMEAGTYDFSNTLVEAPRSV